MADVLEAIGWFVTGWIIGAITCPILVKWFFGDD